MNLEGLARKFFRKSNKKIFNVGILSKKVKFTIPKYVEKFFKETKENISAIHFELDIPLTYEIFSISGHSDKNGNDLWIDSMIFDSKIRGSNIPEKPNFKITLVFDTLKISSYALFEILEDYKDVFDVDFSEPEKFILVKYKVEDFELLFLNGNYL
jgi:ribosomal protein S17E